MTQTFRRYQDFVLLLRDRALALTGRVEEIAISKAISHVIDLSTTDPAQVPKEKQKGWGLILMLGALVRIVSGFFQVIAVMVTARGREVKSWPQLIIAREEEGRIALPWLPGQNPEEDLFLVRFKPEAGNAGIVVEFTTREQALTFAEDKQKGGGVFIEWETDEPGQGKVLHFGVQTDVLVCAPFQASTANMKQHKTNVPLLAWIKALEASQDPVQPPLVPWIKTPRDGARFLRKVNQWATIVLTQAHLPDLEAAVEGAGEGGENAPDFAWVTRPVLREVIRRGQANEFLMEVAGMTRF